MKERIKKMIEKQNEETSQLIKQLEGFRVLLNSSQNNILTYKIRKKFYEVSRINTIPPLFIEIIKDVKTNEKIKIDIEELMKEKLDKRLTLTVKTKR